MKGHHYLGVVVTDDTAQADTGPAVEDAIQLALVEINDSGGIDGKLTGMIRCNAGSDATATAASIEELAKVAPLSAIIGPSTSSGTIASAPIVSAAGIPLVSPSATSPAVTTLDDHDFVFRTIVSDTLQGEAAAAIVKREKWKKPIVVHYDDAYGRGLEAAFANALGSAPPSFPYLDDKAGYADAVVAKAKASGADAVFLISFLDDGIAVVKAAKAAGFSPKWVFAESLQDELFLSGVKDDAYLEGAHGTAPAPASGPAYDAFESSWRFAQGVRPKIYTPNAYDATYLLAAGMKLSGAPDDPRAVRDGLRRTSGGSATFGPGEWPKLVAAAGAGTTVDYQGASGPVDFDAHGDVQSNISEWTIHDGKLETVGCFAAGGVACK
jgi:ABC-type branched-subunit amino acid transport system substrate-binding protein